MIRRTARVWAYHGTTEARAANIEREGFRESQREGLWLGDGTYFFQDAPAHALKWAQKAALAENDGPAVFAAEIDLTKCFDLSDRRHWPLIVSVWEREKMRDNPQSQLGVEAIFQNLSPVDKAILGRNLLDCNVMNKAIQFFEDEGEPRGLEITTVRASFVEEGPVFRTSWLWTGSCTMISVLDPSAILRVERAAISEVARMSSLNPSTLLPDMLNSPLPLNEEIAGVWHLVSHSILKNGSRSKSLGNPPVGLMIIGEGGYISRHIYDPGRLRFASNDRITGTHDENRSAVQGAISNFGRLSVKEAERALSIEVMASSFPNDDNANSVRSVMFVDKELRVTINPTSSGAMAEEVWKRLA